MGLTEVHRGPDAWEARWEAGRANALSTRLVEALHDLLDDAVREHAPALVLRGGERHFAAGFDLSGLASESDASLALRFLRVGVLLERLRSAPFLTVAAVTGAAIGAGADLVAACDHRFALSTAQVGFPGARFGVVLGTSRLAQVAGTDRALDLLSGRQVGVEALAETYVDRTGLEAAVGDLIAGWSRTDPTARPALLAAARPAAGDEPLAALARSVARPGLRTRLCTYADSLKERT